MQFLYQLSALEQFDIIRVISHCKYSGVSNVGLASIYTTILMLSYFYVVFDSIYLSRDLMLKRFFLFSIYRTVKENFNVKNVTYFRFIASIFFVILFGNVTGLIPYYLTTTSYLVITLFISSVCFIGLNIIGIRLHGQKLFSLFVPEGTPFILTPFLIVIEIISYLARVASLSIRLFANMMAGHSLLKILAGFLWTSLENFTYWSVWSWVPLMVVLVVTVLEIMIAFLQSFVYLILVSIYINDVVKLH